ncbi:MAG: Flp pilus assembly protein CpaB [Magnetospirillum sp.]|nr:Flp pilus assembly protein CpaB [Magnetospirillum sp.]
MRPIAVILVVVAALAAGLAAFLAKRWVDTASTAKQGEPVATIDVLVAAHEIAPGTVLKDGDLRYDRWPQAVLSPRLAVKTPASDPKTNFIGTVARFAFADGEPMTQDGVFKQDSGGVVSAMLAPGMRAVSIAVNPVSGVSGLVAPGDHVDVLLAEDVNKADNAGSAGSAGPIVRYAAETVLEDVRVLAIDQQVARSRDGAAIQGKTATVEVTPKQAEILATANMLGQLSLVLRSAAHPEGGASDVAAKEPFTADTEASRALKSIRGKGLNSSSGARGGASVQINRAGAISSKSF